MVSPGAGNAFTGMTKSTFIEPKTTIMDISPR
jgi:hypothetical protein